MLLFSVWNHCGSNGLKDRKACYKDFSYLTAFKNVIESSDN